MTQQAAPSGADLVRCWLPAAPARQLPNLKGIPILIVPMIWYALRRRV